VLESLWRYDTKCVCALIATAVAALCWPDALAAGKACTVCRAVAALAESSHPELEGLVLSDMLRSAILSTVQVRAGPAPRGGFSGALERTGCARPPGAVCQRWRCGRAEGTPFTPPRPIPNPTPPPRKTGVPHHHPSRGARRHPPAAGHVAAAQRVDPRHPPVAAARDAAGAGRGARRPGRAARKRAGTSPPPPHPQGLDPQGLAPCLPTCSPHPTPPHPTPHAPNRPRPRSSPASRTSCCRSAPKRSSATSSSDSWQSPAASRRARCCPRCPRSRSPTCPTRARPGQAAAAAARRGRRTSCGGTGAARASRCDAAAARTAWDGPSCTWPAAERYRIQIS
jgi:hypothetical protein